MKIICSACDIIPDYDLTFKDQSIFPAARNIFSFAKAKR
jgi:hypothetical protein